MEPSNNRFEKPLRLLKALGRKVLLGLKITGKFLLLLPLAAMFMGVNYFVDSAGVFRSNQFEKDIALAMLEGKAVSNYDQMDEQEILKQLVQVMEEPFDTIALGSSRILQMTPEEAGTDSFMNCGVSGSDYIDVMSTFYLFEKAGMLPNNVIIGVDPWLFNPNEGSINWRSDKELFDEYLSVTYGIETGYVPPDPWEQYEPLVDPAYFQSNLKYLLDDDKEYSEPTIVTGEWDEQNTNIKLPWGSVQYLAGYRAETGDAVVERARDSAVSNDWLRDYHEPDPERLELFDQFVQHVKGLGVNVILVLSPFHPMFYTHATENKSDYHGFFLTEPWLAEYAAENEIPLYGSYNPFVTDNFTEDFYDGLHMRGECFEGFFPGVEKVVELQEKGKTAKSPWFTGRVRVEEDTARRIAMEWYGIPEPELARRMEDISIDNEECYVFGWYETEEEDALLLARYAVTKNDGIIYRFDTDFDQWLVDFRYVA